MSFPSRIRDRVVFPRGVARKTEGIGRAGAGRTLVLLASLGRDVGCVRWRGRAGSAGPIPKRSQAGLVRLGRAKDKNGGGGVEERLAGPDSVSRWVSVHYQMGIRKIIFFFKSFYNLQTNLNSIQI
jgi:hypothetical protein